MTEELTEMFGPPRTPSETSPWEFNRSPVSLMKLDEANGSNLAKFADACRAKELEAIARTLTFLWVMEPSGALWVSVEELAELPDGKSLTGHPRRRNFPSHPADEKKLGHPCLVKSGSARIAGELFLDLTEDGQLSWYLNTNSGRYCSSNPPTSEQGKNVLRIFERHLSEAVLFDDLEQVA